LNTETSRPRFGFGSSVKAASIVPTSIYLKKKPSTIGTTQKSKGAVSMSEQLKPCPFCGGSEVAVQVDFLGLGKFKIRMESWWVQCQAEHCYGLQQGSTREKAIKRWNMRHG